MCVCVCLKVCQRHLKFDYYAGVQNPKPQNNHPNVIFSFSDAILWLCIKNVELNILVVDPINLDFTDVIAQSKKKSDNLLA